MALPHTTTSTARTADRFFAVTAMVLAGVWMMAGNLLIAPSGPASNLAINLLSNLGPVLSMVPLGYLGYQLWAESGEGRAGHSVSKADGERGHKVRACPELDIHPLTGLLDADAAL